MVIRGIKHSVAVCYEHCHTVWKLYVEKVLDGPLFGILRVSCVIVRFNAEYILPFLTCINHELSLLSPDSRINSATGDAASEVDNQKRMGD